MTDSTAATVPGGDLHPVSAAERVALIDALRGFALFGVLLANMIPWFSGRFFLSKAEAAARTSTLDEIALVFTNVFIDGKSMTLFSFLFGLGFAVQMMRAEEKGRSAVPVYMRRLAIGIAIGLCHTALIWWGDVVTLYSMTAFLLILFRKRSDRTLLLWAAVLIIVPHLVTAVPPIAQLLHRLVADRREDQAFKDQVLAAMAGTDYGQLVRMQVRFHFGHIAAWHYLWTLGRFLLGYFVGRSRWLHDSAAHLGKFRKLLWWGLGLGLTGTLATVIERYAVRHGATLPPGLKLAMVLPEEIGTHAMAAFYMSAMALLWTLPAWQDRLRVLAPVGQMAFTNYLSQSVICTFLFYGWGLGLIGSVGPALCIPLTVALFSAQILASRWWLQRFRFGPVEWLWRSLTYGKPQPMQRAEPRPVAG